MSAYDVFEVIRAAIEIIAISPIVLWVMYVVVMGIKKRHMTNKYKGWEYLYVGPVVLIFYLVDVFVNYTFASIVLWELPRSWGEEKTVSERLNRYYFMDHGWRTMITAWVGPLLLDPFDPKGKHIGYIEP